MQIAKDMDKKERLEAIIAHYSDSKPSVFAKFLGVAPSTISSWLARNTIDYDLIFAKCENISAEWLLTGKGNMHKETNAISSEPAIDIYKDMIKAKDDLIQQQKEMIEQLKGMIDQQNDMIDRLNHEILNGGQSACDATDETAALAG